MFSNLSPEMPHVFMLLKAFAHGMLCVPRTLLPYRTTLLCFFQYMCHFPFYHLLLKDAQRLLTGCILAYLIIPLWVDIYFVLSLLLLSGRRFSFVKFMFRAACVT